MSQQQRFARRFYRIFSVTLPASLAVLNSGCFGTALVLGGASSNQSPVFDSLISDQTVVAGTAITPVNAASVVSDADSDSLSYTCTFSGGDFASGTSCDSLPNDSYSFDGDTGTLAWTPSASSSKNLADTAYVITLVASDEESDPASDSFTVTVQPAAIALERVYANSNAVDSWLWNYYVDGADSSDDCNAATSTSCIHAGEKRKIVLAAESSCAGLSASDSLNAFQWTCGVVSGAAVFTMNGFQTGKGLKDLLNATSFKNNSVSITNGVNSVSTTPTTWWTNSVAAVPVSPDAAAATVQSLSTAYRIHTVAASGGVGGLYIGADGISLVTLAGATLSWLGASSSCDNTNYGSPTAPAARCLMAAGKGADASRNYLWIEGSFDAEGGANDAHFTLYFGGIKHSKLNKITAAGALTTGDVIHLLDVNLSDINTVSATNLAGGGIYLVDSSYNTFAHLNLRGGNNGLSITGSSTGNYVADVEATGFTASGVHLEGSSNTLTRCSLNSNSTGITIDSATTSTITGINASNNITGILLTGAINNTFSQLVSANNGDGLYIQDTSLNNVLSNVTVTNSNGNGVYITGNSTHQTMPNLLTSNNGTTGLYTAGANSYYYNLTAAHNATYGIHNVGNSTSYKGLISVGNNGGSCEVTAGSAASTNLKEGGGQNCQDTGDADPDLLVNTATSLASSFVGLVSDAVNANGPDTVAGILAFDSITDFTAFETLFRGWGKYGGISSVPTASSNRNACGTGEDCGTWDWALDDSDAVLLSQASCPTGSSTITHSWSGGGSVTFLRDAMEQMDDSVGDDDGLCETGETCIFTPNLSGGYQGHGSLVSSLSESGCADIGTGGAIENVVLLEYDTNGY